MLISTNTAINVYSNPHILTEVKKKKKKKKRHIFWFSKLTQFQGTNSFTLHNMALAVIINTVVTLSARLALSSKLLWTTTE